MGYYHVYSYLSGLGYDAIGMDDRVRCLSYLMRHVAEITTVPADVRFELFVPQYPAPVPAIGLTEDPPIDGPSAQMSQTARHIGEDMGGVLQSCWARKTAGDLVT